MDREDLSCIKDYKVGEVYELPSTVNWIKLFDYINLNFSGSQIWVFAYLDYKVAVKQMKKSLSKRAIDRIIKKKCEFYRFEGRDFRLLYRNIFLYVMEHRSEWLIIKNSERFMEENRSYIQELAQQLNLKVIVLCKEQ
jgi:hypothetical protein